MGLSQWSATIGTLPVSRSKAPSGSEAIAFRPHTAVMAPLRKAEWVVYSKRPFGGPEAVLAISRETGQEPLQLKRRPIVQVF